MTWMSGNGDEVLLPGGYTNAGLVSRVGDTVRRPMRPSSAAVHALLHHLERVGFDGAPRVLGVDERGREVLSYIEGEAAIAPHQPWALTDEALISVAELLRRYHDAAASFDPSDRRWHRPVPAAFRDGLMCHNDPNLDNVVFTQGRAVALIDFDLAAPGSAAWTSPAAGDCGRRFAIKSTSRPRSGSRGRPASPLPRCLRHASTRPPARRGRPAPRTRLVLRHRLHGGEPRARDLRSCGARAGGAVPCAATAGLRRTSRSCARRSGPRQFDDCGGDGVLAGWPAGTSARPAGQ